MINSRMPAGRKRSRRRSWETLRSDGSFAAGETGIRGKVAEERRHIKSSQIPLRVPHPLAGCPIKVATATIAVSQSTRLPLLIRRGRSPRFCDRSAELCRPMSAWSSSSVTVQSASAAQTDGKKRKRSFVVKSVVALHGLGPLRRREYSPDAPPELAWTVVPELVSLASEASDQAVGVPPPGT